MDPYLRYVIYERRLSTETKFTSILLGWWVWDGRTKNRLFKKKIVYGPKGLKFWSWSIHLVTYFTYVLSPSETLTFGLKHFQEKKLLFSCVPTMCVRCGFIFHSRVDFI